VSATAAASAFALGSGIRPAVHEARKGPLHIPQYSHVRETAPPTTGSLASLGIRPAHQRTAPPPPPPTRPSLYRPVPSPAISAYRPPPPVRGLYTAVPAPPVPRPGPPVAGQVAALGGPRLVRPPVPTHTSPSPAPKGLYKAYQNAPRPPVPLQPKQQPQQLYVPTPYGKVKLPSDDSIARMRIPRGEALVFDTSALLDTEPRKLLAIAHVNTVIIPFTALSEIDGHLKSEKLRNTAVAIRDMLGEHPERFQMQKRVERDEDYEGRFNNADMVPDDRILGCAVFFRRALRKVFLVTNDKMLRVKASAEGIPTVDTTGLLDWRL
jgi:rRNA-processing protein FCF1